MKVTVTVQMRTKPKARMISLVKTSASDVFLTRELGRGRARALRDAFDDQEVSQTADEVCAQPVHPVVTASMRRQGVRSIAQVVGTLEAIDGVVAVNACDGHIPANRTRVAACRIDQ